MKKNHIVFSSLLFLGVIFVFLSQSCTKEIDAPSNEIVSNQEGKTEIKGGMLSFSSSEEMASFANNLYKKGLPYIHEWGKKSGFTSQEIIYQRILEEEDKFDSIYYKGIDENISVNQLNKIGLGIKHSELYEKYKKRGFIKEIIEEDGSVSFEPNVPNPAIMNVVDEDGFVLIDKTLLQYSGRKIKTMGINENVDILQAKVLLNSQEASNEKLKVVVHNIPDTNLETKGYGTFTRNIVGEDWVYRGKKLRCKVMYVLYDTENSPGEPLPLPPQIMRM